MTLVDVNVDIFEEMVSSVTFDVWVLLLHDDDNVHVIVPVTALREVLEMTNVQIMAILEEAQNTGKAPVTTGTKAEMQELADRLRQYNLTVTVVEG